jgi:hypothetical protein
VWQLDVVHLCVVAHLHLELVVVRGDEAELLVVRHELAEQARVELLKELRQTQILPREDPRVVDHLHLVDVINCPIDLKLRPLLQIPSLKHILN